jgi:hypothetical protein
MRYIKPQVTGVFRAVSTIKSDKGPSAEEIATGSFTNNAGYQADE